MTLAYPRDLAEFVVPRWNAEEVFIAEHFAPYVQQFELPSMDDVELIISTCYQSSLMSEEQRPVVFRVILGDRNASRQRKVHLTGCTGSSFPKSESSVRMNCDVFRLRHLSTDL
jgi:hypothetical protein